MQQANSDNFSGLIGEAMKNDTDTLVSQRLFFEIFPEESFAYSKLLDSNYIRIFRDESYLSFTFIINFSHIDELNMGMTNLRGLFTMFHQSPFPDEETSKLSHFFSLENERLNRIQVEDHFKNALVSQEQKVSAELFLSETYHKMIFHLPTKPLEINFDNYQTEENKVVIKKSLIEILTGKELVSDSIKY